MSSNRGKTPRLMGEKRQKKQPVKRKKAAPAKRRRAATPAKKGGNVFTRFFRGIFRWITRLVWIVGSRVALIGGLVVAVAVAYFYVTLPPVTDLLDGRTRGSVTILDRNDKVFAWRGDQFGGQISADTVAPALKNAVVATEDKRFYWHPGVDPIGIASAVRINLREGRGPLSGHGGSTLTQQTAKLLCLGDPYDPQKWKNEAAYEADCRRTTLWRKAKEAIYAMAMEAKYTKSEILTIYFNRAYLGAGTRGFEAAAQRYFGKSANKVNASEAAMLAGLLVAPTKYAPTNDLKRSQDRANLVMGLMEDQGYLSAKEAAVAKANPAQLSRAAQARAGGYFADWVMESGPAFLTNDTTEDVIIRSTLDQRIQRAAEDAMQYIFETKVRAGSEAQAAIVVMSSDGAVRAIVGGRQTKVSGAFNRATMAKRQTGSAFKPFVYAAALDYGFTPNATVVDEPYCLNVPGSGEYCPKNYTKDFKGKVTLTQALAQSLNIPAVKVSEEMGRDAVRKIANDFGIESDLADGPALALGASESTLLEMTGAYAGILNGGQSVTPYGLIDLRLQGDREPLFTQQGGLGERVITTEAARSLTYMMSRVLAEGTGTRARLPGREAAGKTGTTSAARDAWFLGFTADYVAGVWMGYDDNTPLTGVTGGGLPADIWKETMVRVHEGLPVKPLPMTVPRQTPTFATETNTNTNTRPRQTNRRRDPDPVERVLIDILRGVFGN
ncbi:transglycosylase domain-containing protein [Actibacterium pelagium]|uniref:peptidoglycan glycosyltransferase n=1 Tax=Actibacterium pelagium TaxID=2029103 RepID=A0A917EIR1_9RHOB|nr:transglycosylase domain-containing protein [Actibacterium pelagium]GGE49807.1 glycosyl transferase family 51 [Actibacterium pelagium]